MHRLFPLALIVLFGLNGYTQTNTGEQVPRPKLVVGIVVDQMRWDFLYRYYDRYTPDGGFRRFLSQGFSCENTLIPYAPTVTAPGHASVYTGATPSIHGIAGNSWWDRTLQREVYCTEDKTVQTVGSSSSLGQMSPRNMITTSICDELRMATNFRSKVVGIAIKDRGAIVTAGHSANAAYWYDNTNGNWITSTYYMSDLPGWVKEFNSQKVVDKYYDLNWATLYPLNTYVQSTSDDKPYEIKGLGAGFPYDLKKFIGKNYSAIATTPYGNSFTLDMARAAVEGEQLGNDNITDFLAVSLSSPDYIGHSFGPNSIEQEDNFLRLDKDLGEFFRYLDGKIGQQQYIVFLTADHGVAHVPGFMKENKLPGGTFDGFALDAMMNEQLRSRFGASDLISSSSNYQITINPKVLADNKKLDKDEVIKWVIDFMSKQPGISRVFPVSEIKKQPMNSKVAEMLANGIFPGRAGDIQVILEPNWLEGFTRGGTSHGAWNPYDSHIPLLWYGWGVKQGKTNRETYMTDIAPTLAAMLRIQMPNGSVGTVITEAMK